MTCRDTLICRTDRNSDFTCRRCRALVLAHNFLSGVQHRNHCPWCLWSRHMDLYRAGDRLSACRGLMRPVGLALKRVEKKYGFNKPGELMLVHWCEDCGRLSLNRIAADDDIQAILAVFRTSLALGQLERRHLEAEGIYLLEEDDYCLVEAQLFGWQRVTLAETCWN